MTTKKEELTMQQQLGLLKDLTVRMGMIHEAQTIQLKHWPLLVPNVDKAKAEVDVERKLVIYTCEAQKFRKTKKVKLYFENIDAWTKTLLWDDTTVQFMINGDLLYDSRNK
jgi:hypothetical protein